MMTDEELEAYRLGIANRFGLVVAKSKDEEVVNAASATFVSIDDQRLVITADHVIRGLSERGRIIIQVASPEVLAAPETACPAVEFELALYSRLTIRRGDEDHLDLAIFPAPQDLSVASHLGWFNGDRDLSPLRELRQLVERQRNPRLAALLVGYPIFSRFRDPHRRVQTFAPFPIWAAIERFDAPADITDRDPQIILELDLPAAEDLPADVGPLHRGWVQRLRAMTGANLESEDEPTPLGGYSGGPLVYCCEAGQYLLGTMKGGGVRVGGHAFVTPLDAIVSAVRACRVHHVVV